MKSVQKKPEVLMLVTGGLFDEVFRQETLEKLHSFAQVIVPAEKGIAWEACLPTAEGIITSWGSLNDITEEVLDRAPKLRIIAHGAGSARRCAEISIPRGITVVNAAGAIARSVAEYCLGMTIACLRRIPQHDQNVKECQSGQELRDRRAHSRGLFLKKVGLVGFGYTAREFSKLLGVFDADISAFDPYVEDSIMDAFGVKRA